MAASLPNARVGAIIVAAGASSRMGAAGDKTLADLAGEPLIARTVDAFERCDAVSCVALVVSERNRDAVAALREAKGWRKTLPPVLGGARRQDSVRAGLEALPDDCGWIVVHDGARPFVTPALIEAGLEAAHPTGASVAVVPAFDTVKRVAPDGSVAETLDRAELRMAQTPQVFRRDVLERAHAEVADDATDDAAMAERVGVEVRTFAGDRGNIKITTAEDLGVAKVWVGVTYPLTDPIMNEELSVANKFAQEHEDAFSLIDKALNQVYEGFRMMPTHRKYEDARTWSVLLGMRAFKGLRSARTLLEHGYYEQALSLCRTAMEHIVVECALSLLGTEKQSEILRKLQNKDRFESRGEIGDILKQLQSYGFDNSGWKTHYARLNEHVHVSGARDQLVFLETGSVHVPFLHYSRGYALGVLYHISGLLWLLMDIIYRVTQAEGIVWGDITIRNALIDLSEESYQAHESMAGKEEYIITD